MNEEPKSIWKKSLTGWCILSVVALLLAFAGFLAALASSLFHFDNSKLFGLSFFVNWLILTIGAAATFLVLILLFRFIRWLYCWRNFKRFLFAVACLATLIALFYAEEDWRGKHAWETFKREWEAKGERFDRASVVPPPVPDDQNFALTPIVFTSYGQLLTRDGKFIPWAERDTNFVNRLQVNIGGPQPWPTNGDWRLARVSDLSAWQQYYRALAAKTNQFPVPPQPVSPAADVLFALGKYDSTIEELRQAGQLPDSRFPLEYDKDDPAAMLLPHLAPLKNCAQVLQLRALAELQNGQSDRALADVKLILRLADSLRSEPILISQLVRAALVNLALQPIWEGLRQRQWSDAQLIELGNDLAKTDFLAASELALRGERIWGVEIIEYLRHLTYRERLRTLSAFGSNLKLEDEIFLCLGPAGWFDQSELRISRFLLRHYSPVVNLDRQIVSPVAVRNADEAFGAEVGHSGNGNFFERLLLSAAGNVVEKLACGQNAVNLARTACALERYRLAHGQYPESLDALVPQFIAELPHDVINGQPLHYRRTDDGSFVLYSVGWNETDDGGEVGFTKQGGLDISTGDWVWQYPQK